MTVTHQVGRKIVQVIVKHNTMARKEKKKFLARAGFKLFGHKSHIRGGKMLRNLNKGDVLDNLALECQKKALTR